METKNNKQTRAKPKKTVTSITSDVDPLAWFNEVASVMEGKFSDSFILAKAKEAFGVQFDDSRFKDIKGSLKERVLNVWESQK